MCSLFCEQGGAIYLLDLATSASNPYDMVAFPVFSKIAQVIKSMCEAKPHLVGLFATFIDLSKPQISLLPAGADGTTIAKSLAMTHMLTHVLSKYKHCSGWPRASPRDKPSVASLPQQHKSHVLPYNKRVSQLTSSSKSYRPCSITAAVYWSTQPAVESDFHHSQLH